MDDYLPPGLFARRAYDCSEESCGFRHLSSLAGSGRPLQAGLRRKAGFVILIAAKNPAIFSVSAIWREVPSGIYRIRNAVRIIQLLCADRRQLRSFISAIMIKYVKLFYCFNDSEERLCSFHAI